MRRLTVSAVRLVGGPHDGVDVLVADGVLQLELPGNLDQVLPTGNYAHVRRAIYARALPREPEMAFQRWEGGAA